MTTPACDGCPDRACPGHPGSATYTTAEEAARGGMDVEAFRRERVRQAAANALLGERARTAEIGAVLRRLNAGGDVGEAERDITMRHGLPLGAVQATYVSEFTFRRIARARRR